MAGFSKIFAQSGQRIELHALTAPEQQKLADLIHAWLDENPGIIQEHAACFEDGIHSTNNFLPWHRVHIRELEDYIRENALVADFPNISNINDESFRLPMWRPETVPATGDKIPLAFQTTADPVTYPVNTPQSTMNFNPDPDDFPIMEQFLERLKICQNLADAGFFSDVLEAQYHDNGHSIIGGRMNEGDAPACLIFWPWHAWVDDLWYYWENTCQGEYDLPFSTTDVISQTFTEIQAPGVIWSGEMFVKGEVIVKSGATLTIGQNAVVHFRESSYNGFPTRIIVEPGGTLIVDGATLTGIDVFGNISNVGDIPPGAKYYTAWEGIVVQSSPGNEGWVEMLNEARIEHAITGIRSENGGNIYANNANFYNNRVDVEVAPYSGVCYASFFHCEFINDQALRDIVWKGAPILENQSSGCPGSIPEHHINHEDSHSSDAHIILNNATGLWKNFQYCTIDNQYQDPHGHYISRGIVANNSQYSVYGCSIKNQVIGISGTNAVPGPGRHATVRSSYFENNFEGITLLGVDYSEISTNNTFTVPDEIPLGVAPADILSNIGAPFGIYSDGSSALTVADNSFSTTGSAVSTKNYGAILANTSGSVILPFGSTASVEKRNSFTGVGIGSQPQGGNSQLQIRCNNYNSFELGIAVTSGALQNQGVCSPLPNTAAGNTWDNLNNCSGNESQVYKHPINASAFTYSANQFQMPTCRSAGITPNQCITNATATSCDDITMPCVGCEEQRIAELEIEKGALPSNDEHIQFITHEQQLIYQQGVNERLGNENEGVDIAITFTEEVEAITSLWPGNKAGLLLLKSEQDGTVASGTIAAIAAISESDPTKKWFNLSYGLLSSGRTYNELTAPEKAMVEAEAAQHSKSGAHAKAILEMAYGIPVMPNIEPIDGERNIFSAASYQKGKAMGIVPNPAQDHWVVSFIAPETTHQSSLEITDINGRVLRQFDLSSYFGDSRLPVVADGFSPGIYLVRLNLNGVFAGIEKIALIR